MSHTITMRFEVYCDTPSEVQARARQLVVDALLVHMRRDDISDDDETLIDDMLSIELNPPAEDAGAVIIDGTWTKEDGKRGEPPRYTAIGTKAEVIELRRTRPKSHRGGEWILTVSPADGKERSITLGTKATFDDAEGALLVWGTL